jgi:DnaJ-class molecular chaperone
VTEIFEIPNYEPMPPNGETQEEVIDAQGLCKECHGNGGWDETMFDEETDEEFEGWIICDECDGTGFKQ